MIVSFFKKQKLYWQFYLGLYLLVLKGIWFYTALVKQPEILRNSWFDAFLPSGVSIFFSLIAALVIVYLLALLMNAITARHSVLYTSSALMGMAVILLSSISIPLQGLGIYHLLLVLFMLIHNKLFKANLKEDFGSNIFDSAFLIGVGSLFFPPFAFGFIALLIAIPVLGLPKGRYFGLGLVGFLMPWYLFAAVKFFQNDLGWFLNWWENLSEKFFVFPKTFDWLTDVSVGLMLLASLASVINYLSRLSRIPTSIKNYLTTSLFFVIFGWLAVVLFPEWRVYSTAALVIPVGVLLGHTFYYMPKLLASVLHIVLVTGAVALPLLGILKYTL